MVAMSASPLKNEPVVVTGLGAFGAGGACVAELWQNAVDGRASVQMRDLPNHRLPVYAAPEPVFSREDAHLVRYAGRATAMALAAAKEAWQHAALAAAAPDPARLGLVLGSSRGPADVVAAVTVQKRMRRSNSIYTSFSSIAGIIASALDIQGGTLSVSATCASGGAAAYTGMQMLRSGEFDAVLVGCVDAPLIDSILEQLAVTGVLSSRCGNDALRPFDLHRDGTVLGEGAAFMLLESSDFALRRGAPVQGLLQAVTLTCESQARSRPSEDGERLQRAVRTALQQSSLAAADVDLVHLHGMGAHLNDAVESRCARALFGEVQTQPVGWASKAITGHTLGAAALFIAVLTLEAMRHSHVPGTTNCFTPDPACPIRLSLGKGEARPIHTAVCLTSGFWGNNACLVLRAAETLS